MTKAYLQRFVVGLSLTAETYNDNCNGNRKFKKQMRGFFAALRMTRGRT